MRLSEAKIVSERDFMVHGTEPKKALTLSLPRGSDIEVIRKDVSKFSPSNIAPSSWYVSLWQKYKDGGVATHDWMLPFDNESVITPNLFKGGYRIYGKSSFVSLPHLRFTVSPDETDLLITALHDKEILEEVERHVEKASNAGIVLPYDDPYELLVHESGKWEIRTLDITFTAICDPEQATYKNCVQTFLAENRILNSRRLMSEILIKHPQLF